MVYTHPACSSFLIEMILLQNFPPKGLKTLDRRLLFLYFHNTTDYLHIPMLITLYCPAPSLITSVFIFQLNFIALKQWFSECAPHPSSISINVGAYWNHKIWGPCQITLYQELLEMHAKFDDHFSRIIVILQGTLCGILFSPKSLSGRKSISIVSITTAMLISAQTSSSSNTFLGFICHLKLTSLKECTHNPPFKTGFLSCLLCFLIRLIFKSKLGALSLATLNPRAYYGSWQRVAR